jgi:hypothetical protein
MKLFFSFLLLVLTVSSASAQTQRISIESLGRLSLNFAAPQIVPSVPTPAVNGEVSYLPGNGYQLVLPFRVLQRQYLVAPQAYVSANTPLVKLSGSEVHHFYEMLRAQKEIYSQAEQRYQQNLPLFKSKSINQQSWQAITDHYFASKLELGHLEHAKELLQSANDDDAALLISPVAGVFIPAGEQLDTEAFVYGEVIEQDALRLKVQLPSQLADKISALTVGSCHLKVAYRERLHKGLVSRLWSASVTANDECELMYADSMMVTPVIEQAGLAIPASSVYFFEDQYYALAKDGAELLPVAVTVLGRHEGQLLIADNMALKNSQVLTSSVSAVQGLLLGLGGE